MFDGIKGDQFRDWLQNPRWAEKPVTIKEFVYGKDYLDQGANIYNFIYQLLEWIFGLDTNGAPYYNDVTILAGIGSGKSFTAQIALVYMAYLLMCHNDAHSTYKVSKDKPITIGNAGPSAQQCQKVVFKGYSSLMLQSPWFRDRLNDKLFQQRSINIANKGLEMRSGNSSAEFFIGSNVLAAIIDEASFHIQTADQDSAEELYTGLSRRITSRFGGKGLMITISSPKGTSDFTVRKFEEVKAYNNCVYLDEEKLVEAWEHIHENGIRSLVVRAPTWACKNRDTMSPEEFDFKLSENKILKIPMQFKKDFDKDPAKALLDFGALPVAVSQVLYSMPELIDVGVNPGRFNPCMSDGTMDPDFRPIPGMIYYAHIDLSYRSDKTALAICHRTGNAKSKDGLPRVAIDLIKVWDPKDYPGRELPIQDVRNYINMLRTQGFIFKLITLDQFQSRDTIQQLRLQGMRSELLSIDRRPDIHYSLREAIYTKTLNYFQHDLLFKELKELKVSDGKVDHPYGSSKDVADAVAGAHWNAVQDVFHETKVDYWEL